MYSGRRFDAFNCEQGGRQFDHVIDSINSGGIVHGKKNLVVSPDNINRGVNVHAKTKVVCSTVKINGHRNKHEGQI